jgi:diguanylate cyclase (GGDEF)-like protein
LAKRVIPVVFVALLALAGALAGWLKPFNDRLTDQRMALLSRPPIGDIVLIDIDSKSISRLGSWPWSRHVHGAIIDGLVRLDAGQIAFDVDFSAPSTPNEDAALAAALERAGGSVILPAFDQKATARAVGEPLHHNRPIGIFAAHAWLASVNVTPDTDGKVRRLDYVSAIDGAPMPSLAAMLAGGATAMDAPFRIDFGIRADEIDRISAIDLIEGRIARERIAGKKVIIGAEAMELRDVFHVPVYGTVSGALLQALGAESIAQGRALTRTRPIVTGLGLAMIAALAMYLGRRRGWKGTLAVLAGVCFAVEAAALGVQRFFPVELATAAWQFALCALMLFTLLREIDFRRILLAISRTHAANTQTILDRVIADNFAGVLVIDGGGTVVAASHLAEHILGAGARLAGANATDILPAELNAAIHEATTTGRPSGSGPREIEFRSGDVSRILEFVVTPSRLSGGLDQEGHKCPDELATCLTFVDVTERRQAADRIAYLARFDPMTGLPNRNQFLEQVATALQAAKTSEPCAILCLDLDRFKIVNDTLGHGFGDQLLCTIAQRLTTFAPPGAGFARLGGDDFAIVLSGHDAGAQAVALAKLLTATVNQSYEVEGRRAVVSMSVGIATAAAGEADPLASLKQADTALYRAKEKGGNCHVVFDPAMVAGLEARQRLEVELWDAFEKGEFDVFYQPQVRLADGLIIGAEALLRWRHPERGFVPPSEFIPVIEAIGLMEPAGRLVLAKACAAAARWPADITLAVNVSSVQFTRDDLVTAVSGALAESGLPGARLELEITESLFLHENQALITTMDRIRDMGVRFALDDFGVGYSSLSYINRFPIEKIKIDRSFIVGIPHDHGSVAIVRAVTAMAESLRIRVIAEGIDRHEHIWQLRLLGCHEGQGFLFAKPMPEEEFVQLLQAQLRDKRELRAV